MELTKKIELEILETYHNAWDAYFRGDVDRYAEVFSEDFRIIGTSEAEQFNSKKGWIDFCRLAVSQFAGIMKLENLDVQLVAAGEMVMLEANGDSFAKIDDEWRFYSKYRETILIRKENGRWKYFHQHGSLPDARAGEGEIAGVEQIREENQQLKEAVKRRTTELEIKNRELEIETSLERVRAVAMSMKTPDDLLKISEVLYKELGLLGITELRNAVIQTYVDEKGYFNDYDYSDFTGGVISHVPYTGNLTIERFIDEIKKSKDAFTELIVSGQELEQWKKFRLANNEAPDLRLDSTNTLCYYIYSVGIASIGISTFAPIGNLQLELLKRFRNVFNLAYNRFVDITNAEAQTREAEIELSLERVRAKTMAMHKSEELNEVVAILYDQFYLLGFAEGAATITIMDESTGDMDWWMSGFGNEKYPQFYTVRNFNHWLHQEQLAAWKRGDKYIAIEIEGQEKRNYDEIIFNQSGFNVLPPEVKTQMTSLQKVVFSLAYMKYGALTFGPGAISGEQAIVLQRFAKVFEQTYTRFLDLKKSEAQAREATIEAALEKVRSRSLAMRKSEELKEVVAVLFEKLKSLDIPVSSVGINLYIDDSKDTDVYVCGWSEGRLVVNQCSLPYLDNPISNDLVRAREAGVDFLIGNYSEEEKNSYYTYLFEHSDLQFLPADVKNVILGSRQYSIAMVPVKNSMITVNDFEGRQLSVDETDVLKRFAKVFEQAYTRFLDLKKAEVQARESQIQLALERVRARTMAMQRSNELADASNLLDEQVRSLGINTWGCAFNIYGETDSSEWFGTATSAEFNPYKVPREDVFKRFYDHGQAGDSFYIEEFDGQDCVDHYEYLCSLPVVGDDLKKARDAGFSFPKRQIDHVAYFRYGYLLFITLEPVPESYDIFKRFAKVFEQTYTRFLDLQKAEEQAKESQVQLALERVRARTMAMQHSDELIDAANVLFQQTEALGGASWNCGFNIWDDDKKFATAWNGSKLGIAEPFRTPSHEDVYARIYAADQRGESLYVEEMGGPDLVAHYEYLGTLPGVGHILAEFKAAGIALPTFQIIHVAFFSHGYLMFITYEPVPQLWDVFKRLAKVFEQTYTRFLDLKNAEAQARESLIQLALERIRARTMAMQKSSELREIIQAVFEQLIQLNLHIEHAGFIMDYKAKDDMSLWIADKRELPSFVTIPYFDSPHWNSYNEAKKKGLDFFTNLLDFETKNRFYTQLFEFFPELPEETRQYYFECAGLAISTVLLDNVGLYIENFSGTPYSEADNNTLMRFGRVFQQAYTRFLDLQKAEEQARESMIQLALERVRARTMAMHSSDELGEAATLLFKQVAGLGIETYASGFNIWSENYEYMTSWMSNPTGSINPPFELPVLSHEQHRKIYESWKNQETFLVHDIKGDAIREHYRFLRSFSLLNEAFERAEALGIPTPDRQVHNMSLFSHGYLLFITMEPYPQHHSVFERFGKVFEQTYRRYLDLKKAEAQAKEAQVEAALEKVRSRSLAMHTSEEIKDVVRIAVEKVVELDIEMNGGVSFVTFEPDSKDLLHWIFIPGQLENTFTAGLPYFDHIMFKECDDARRDGTELIARTYSGKLKDDYFNHIFSQSGFQFLPEDTKSWVLQQPYFGFSYAIQKHSGIFLNDYTGKYFSKETNDILVRFSKVFEQAYVRFLDLQKAEAQAREAHIEAALEKVRSRSLAMHHSDEIGQVVWVTVEKLRELNIQLNAISLVTFIPGSKDTMHWYVNPDQDGNSSAMFLPYFDDTILRDCMDAKNSGVELLVKLYSKEEKNNYFNRAVEVSDFKNFPEELKQWVREQPFLSFSFAIQKHSGIFLEDYSGKIFTEAENNILIRFSKVFEQAYVRFLDLQKAEAQAREGQIQLALERVRARTMAMQHSDELADTSSILFQQIKELGFETWSCGFCTWQKGDMVELWMGADAGGLLPPMQIPYKAEPTHRKIYEDFSEGKPGHSNIWDGPALEEHYTFLKTIPSVKEAIDLLEKSGLQLPARQCYYVGFFEQGYLLLITKEPYDELKELSKRFSKVFDQTYTRFLDLKKAEQQTREVQINLAVERVRARALAMFKSEEILEVVHKLKEEILGLNISDSIGATIHLKEKDGRSRIWDITSVELNDEDLHHPMDLRYVLEETDPGFFMRRIWENESKYFVEVQDENDFPVTMQWLRDNDRGQQAIETEQFIRETNLKKLFHATTRLNNGRMTIDQLSEPRAEMESILEKMGAAFDLAYKRFEDLKNSESQLRESQIEAALERVRSIAMSMMKSEDLPRICESVFVQLSNLGFNDLRSAQIYVRNDAGENFTNYDYSEATAADKVEVGYNSHPQTRRVFDVISAAGDSLVHNVIEKNDLAEWKSYLYNTLGQPLEPSLEKADELHYYLYSFGTGAFGISTFRKIDDEELQILRRFRNVFSLSYQRYTDIALAEAQARESKIEAALERVRSRTMAMQKSEELAETAAVLFQQLIGLGIEPNRLYISTIKDEKGASEFWITDEDGSKVSTGYTANLNENETFIKMYAGWKQQLKSLVIVMEGEELENYFKHLTSLGVPFKGGLTQKKRVQDIAYFSNGFIGIASPEEQPAETLQLLERFSYVFNLTYTRFNDLKLAEAHALQAEQDLVEIKAARQRAEVTLNELQVTQTQLIQKEKMASLGELTAGIAHEIQNPLNFVNNFSEVSGELLDELFEAAGSGQRAAVNSPLITELLAEIKQNLSKINHHGKRADAIVKGMLEHSRLSSGQREPTDIAALADEYLRLAYHGFRAKDHSFNSDIRTDLDKAIPLVNLARQDIARVLLNLYNNALYAVNEKRKQSGSDFQPVVTVSTKMIGDQILISVEDNGHGIPADVAGKIFQPFFTTKPTGQGTGLGLSLSYDIVVKGHSGEITVETEAGKGSKFMVLLPGKL